eukprot:366351-Chlamydomonas_euryale.AAC.1
MLHESARVLPSFTRQRRRHVVHKQHEAAQAEAIRARLAADAKIVKVLRVDREAAAAAAEASTAAGLHGTARTPPPGRTYTTADGTVRMTMAVREDGRGGWGRGRCGHVLTLGTPPSRQYRANGLSRGCFCA